MTDFIDYWDADDKEQKRRQCTQEEQASIDALRAAALLPQVPHSVTRKAARLALLNSGKFHTVQTAISSLNDPDRTRTQIEWDDSTMFERASPTVILLGTAIGLSSDDLDQLFIQAAALQ